MFHRLCSVFRPSVALPFAAKPSIELAADHREIAERIRCNLPQKAGRPDCEQVVHAALCRLRDDLLSERCGEVLQELEREIAFRKWCDEQTREVDHPNYHGK